MAEIRSLKPDSKVQSIVGDQSAPHLFSFLEIDWSTTNYEELRYHLERHYNVPSTEHWGFAARKFRMLQMYFEIGTNTAHEAWGEEEMSNVAAHENSPELAKKSDMTVESEIPKQTPALPRVKLFKACTFLMRVATTNEPLICKAFGTIAPTLYEEIFWEKLAVLEREQDVSINVLSITHLTAQDVVFFIEFGGHEFKIRYLQWGTLIQRYVTEDNTHV
ncbi:uncharacterized protein LY89DRAFT_420844 [Mollisia scopiformis]|uniref:Uncharacterized protein n=1 Tax=Mollisia scopiformis TaxID=149040 RepID=A0A194XLF3_MOLSC|nr:uncharacterized protein LY89DRAFT_420844 [Mollisia scopiformis]KUJ20961.1 hypothetical protein LY89DRAFT_420844 [Mollisia scopiformis]